MLKFQMSILAILVVAGAFFVFRFANFESPETKESEFEAKQREMYESKTVNGHIVLAFEPRTVIPNVPAAIKEIPVQSVADADERIKPDDLVLGVSIGDQSRAYPITMLSGPSREIINDQIGEHLIAATW